MRKDVVVNILGSIPKLELHLHLEGAAPPKLVRRLGEDQDIDLTGLFKSDGSYNSSDFSTFLQSYEQMSKVFARPESYKALVEEVLTECANHGVIYTEIFLSPTSLGYDAGEWAEMLAAIEAGADAAEARHGIICRFIPVCIRHHGPEKALEGVKVMLASARGRMTGFGMAGDERVYQPRDFKPAFDCMSEAGFELTCHAGEWGGAESVRATLDALNVSRIGHGVRSAEDPELMQRIAAEGVTLEICPGSNVALGVYPSWHAHSIEVLRSAGCRVTVSTDDPPFFHTTMTHEYKMLSKVFGYGQKEFEEFAANAVDAAFCDNETKGRIRAALNRRME
jgi:adenosine deaminase